MLRVPGGLVQSCHGADGLRRGLSRVQGRIRVLRHELRVAPPLAKTATAHREDILSSMHKAALVGLKQPDQQSGKSGLARTTGTHDSDDLTGSNG